MGLSQVFRLATCGSVDVVDLKGFSVVVHGAGFFRLSALDVAHIHRVSDEPRGGKRLSRGLHRRGLVLGDQRVGFVGPARTLFGLAAFNVARRVSEVDFVGHWHVSRRHTLIQCFGLAALDVRDAVLKILLRL